MALRRNPLINLFWHLHPYVYRWSGGRIGGAILGLPVLLLTTKGRRSGQQRTKALMYLPHGDAFAVFASVLGEPRHPMWWLNLETDPAAWVVIGRRHYAVRAREAEGEERQALWQALTEKVPAYDAYQAKTTRRIPVVVLEPQAELSD